MVDKQINKLIIIIIMIIIITIIMIKYEQGLY